MHYPSLPTLFASRKTSLGRGPVALVLVEDGVAITETTDHLQSLGFDQIVAFGMAELVPDAWPEDMAWVDYDLTLPTALCDIVNAMIRALPGTWLYWGYNAEFLYYPFSETRGVGEMLTFMTEERRNAVMTTVLDLYARDLTQHPSGVDRLSACFDKSGYYALPVRDADGTELDQQVEVFGGLRWRFEEHIPKDRQRLDRVALVKAQPGLQMLPDRRFNVADMNTYACPWHNNLTGAVASFRTAKALRRNPGSRSVITTFNWPQSERFSWSSSQLLDLGLMEPGQWF